MQCARSASGSRALALRLSPVVSSLSIPSSTPTRSRTSRKRSGWRRWMGIERAQSKRLRTAVLWVAVLNLAYFGVEFTTALAIGSVSLFADSVDFLEDASINILIAVAIGWTARRRAFLGMVLAIILLIPAMAGLWAAWQKLASPRPAAPLPPTPARTGALAVTLTLA